MYNLYSILKTPEHDLLLVRRLHSMSPALLPSGRWFEPHIVHNESARHDQQAAVTCLGRSCGRRA
jgi:hypothetical protein